MPLILLTNDDGVYSPGLLAAASSLEPLGDLLIVAPASQQSGASRSLRSDCDGRIFSTLLEDGDRRFPAWRLDGTPAQAVLYGVIEVAARMAGRRPDLVVSGINYGENLGSQTLISGTVGAALQGGDMGIRSLAVSLQTSKDYHLSHGRDVDWSAAVHWLRFFAGAALGAQPWPPDVAALKIDIPDAASAQTPWRLTTQSRQEYFVSRSRRAGGLETAAPLDYEVFVDEEHLETDADIRAFAFDRVISVTPLSVNLSARIALPAFETLLCQAAG
jgi:5'-nucleotidase